MIGALVTHVGSGMPSEIDHALDVLSVLVEHHCPAMQRFTILIKARLSTTAGCKPLCCSVWCDKPVGPHTLHYKHFLFLQ